MKVEVDLGRDSKPRYQQRGGMSSGTIAAIIIFALLLIAAVVWIALEVRYTREEAAARVRLPQVIDLMFLRIDSISSEVNDEFPRMSSEQRESIRSKRIKNDLVLQQLDYERKSILASFPHLKK